MSKVLFALSLFLLSIPAAALAAGKAVVVVTDAGGVAGESAQTARRILQSELRSNGVEVIVSQVDDMCSTAFNRACKSGIIPTHTGEWHWLILSLQRIKMNGKRREQAD